MTHVVVTDFQHNIYVDTPAPPVSSVEAKDLTLNSFRIT